MWTHITTCSRILRLANFLQVFPILSYFHFFPGFVIQWLHESEVKDFYCLVNFLYLTINKIKESQKAQKILWVKQLFIKVNSVPNDKLNRSIKRTYFSITSFIVSSSKGLKVSSTAFKFLSKFCSLNLKILFILFNVHSKSHASSW